MPKRVIPAVTEDFLKRDGLSAAPQAWEDGVRAGTGPGSFEWWYFDSHFPDGSSAVIVYATKPLTQPNAPLTPTVMLTITRPDGTRLPSARVFPAGEFAGAKDRCDVRVGTSWARGDLHRYQVYGETQGLAADLIFTGRVPPWRPGAGKCYFDEALTRYFAWLPAIPFGHVEGRLTYDGHAHWVEGEGYHDHNWGTVALNQVMSHWYWGRAHVGEFSVIFVEQTATAEYGLQKLPVFMLAKGDRILTGDGQPLTLEVGDLRKHSGGREYPEQVDFHWQGDQGTVHIALRRPQIIEASSLLVFLPAWKQRLLRHFANPYYFRFSAGIQLSVDLPGVDGGVRADESGQAIYELMLLR